MHFNIEIIQVLSITKDHSLSNISSKMVKLKEFLSTVSAVIVSLPTH